MHNVLINFFVVLFSSFFMGRKAYLFSFLFVICILCFTFSSCGSNNVSPAVARYCRIIEETTAQVKRQPHMSDVSLRKLNQKINSFNDRSNTLLTKNDKQVLCDCIQELAHAVILENANLDDIPSSAIKSGLNRVDNYISQHITHATTLNELIHNLNR